MAKSFAITTTATQLLRADAKGHAQAIFTVTNTTARPVRGLARNLWVIQNENGSALKARRSETLLPAPHTSSPPILILQFLKRRP